MAVESHAMTDPRISAVVCTHGRAALLAEAVTSLARQTLAPSAFEIVVVDNGSRDTTPTLLATLGAEIANLRTVDEPVLGVARARNTGSRAARAQLVAYLDDDARAEPTWLEAVLSAFAAFPQSGCIGGPVRPRWPAARPWWLSDALLSYLAVIDLGPISRPLAAGEWLAGTNSAFRKEALAGVGGFRDALGRHGPSLLSDEDVEAVASLMAAGWPVVYDPALVVHHTIPVERLTLRWFLRRAYWQGISEATARRERVREGLPPRRAPRRARGGLDVMRLACGAARRVGLAVGGRRWADVPGRRGSDARTRRGRGGLRQSGG